MPAVWKIRCNDDVIVPIREELVTEVGYLLRSIDQLDLKNPELKLDFVSSTTMQHVVTFLTFFENMPMYNPPVSQTDAILPDPNDPSVVFLRSLSTTEFQALSVAADDLDIHRLLDYAVYTVLRSIPNHVEVVEGIF